MTLAALVGVATTVSLGMWQLSRADQKLALQASRDAQQTQPPLDNEATLRSGLERINSVARLRGTWVVGRTMFLDNRQMQARVGFFAITPLRLLGSERVVLVQRGWVPRNFEQRESVPAVETPSGVVEVHGRLALPPSKLYEPGQTARGTIRQNLDLAQFSSETGLDILPLTLQQTGDASEGLLRDWPALNLGVEKHYGYAAQWFGLAALIAGLYLWFQVIKRFFLRSKESDPHV